MQLFEAETLSYSYINKYDGRKMNKTQFQNVLRRFFSTAGRKRTQGLIEKLQNLHAVLSEAEGLRFFSSSLLIAYDEEHRTNTECEVTLKMIDFAHSTFVGFLDDKIYSGPDEVKLPK